MIYTKEKLRENEIQREVEREIEKEKGGGTKKRECIEGNMRNNKCV